MARSTKEHFHLRLQQHLPRCIKQGRLGMASYHTQWLSNFWKVHSKLNMNYIYTMLMLLWMPGLEHILMPHTPLYLRSHNTAAYICGRRCKRTWGGQLSGGNCHHEEGVLWGVLPSGPDGGLCLHCTATCTGHGVCSLWRPPLLPQILEEKSNSFLAM